MLGFYSCCFVFWQIVLSHAHKQNNGVHPCVCVCVFECLIRNAKHVTKTQTLHHTVSQATKQPCSLAARTRQRNRLHHPFFSKRNLM